METYTTAALTADIDPQGPTPTVIDLDGAILTHINGDKLPPNWVIEFSRVVPEPEVPMVNVEITVLAGPRGSVTRDMITITLTSSDRQTITLADGPARTAGRKPARKG